MHKPLPSVAALARFSFTQQELDYACEHLLAETDWQSWIDQIELHGLSGFVNKHVLDYDLPIPDALRTPLKALKARHTAASQARYQVLSEIDKVFTENGVPYLALKGAALMPYLFKEGYLRPMRDIDLLLPDNVIEEAANYLREIGFDLPHSQPSAFMRGMHQLPNATKTVNGYVCSVELHRNGVSRDTDGDVPYPSNAQALQKIQWQGLEFNALEDVQMLHQVSRHLEGVHPGSLLKLINAMDVIGLASHIHQTGQWARLEKEYPHVINTLRCLHLLTPLPETLQEALNPMSNKSITGVGEIMQPLKSIVIYETNVKKKMKLLLSPSDWWLHLYYNVSPSRSLWWVKLVRHPLRVSNWLLKRIYSGLVGG